MIARAKHSDFERFRQKGIEVPQNTKGWGLGWLLENDLFSEGMKILDVGHGTNRWLLEAFSKKGVEVWAMDKLTTEDRLGGLRTHYNEYLEKFESYGGKYIDRYCGDSAFPDELEGKFDGVISIGALEHVFEWGFPLGNLKILHEMMRMLKKGGILTNIYEPHVYYDNSFNWKNDLYFLEVFLAPLSGRGVFFDRPVQEVFSPHEILSDPDTYIDADVSSVGQFKMINSWTALGYIGRKTQDLPRSFATHYDFGKNRCYTDVEHQLKEISIEKLSTLKASEIRILGSDARIMAIKEIFKLQFPMVEYVGYSDLLEKIEKGDAVSDKRTVVVDPFFFLFRDRFFLELLKQESLYVLSELRCSQNLNLETKIRKFNRLLTALNIESFAILGNGGHTQQVLDIMKELGVDRNYQIYVSEISDFQGKDIKCLESGPVEESILLLSSESYEKEMISLLQRNGQMDECFVFPLYHLNKIKALGDSRHAQ